MTAGTLEAKITHKGQGNVVWTGHLPRALAVPSDTTVSSYNMVRAGTSGIARETIDEIEVTNQFCGRGKGWDIVVCGTIMQHEHHKTDAQHEAEKLLDNAPA